MTVQDFGAKGDGLADDTEAFRAAGKSKALKIKVPPGVYQIGEVEMDSRFTPVKRAR